ncbi:hypothetical protein [Nocardiopsis ansamitocini]|uniref:DNA-binding protein n=1 Tax=Nocardiopsis ansamitocini TaxID=1670832 RepID=A0A9W6P9E1_9ACTN|nr:hypothetical protein [Nocardiopsis ansamitocini]GLU49449.1 hypothetical protein Nans01_38000 [Nocardiopsis ansamitocini]
MTATHSTAIGLLDAGLAPLDIADDGHIDPVRARGYTHPALGERRLVRLVPDTLAPAEDAALEFLNFAAPTVSEPLSMARPRGLGYPEWALVHDPERTAEALALVKPMERAARTAATRPGAAIEAFTRLATTVPVAHLASYWEQVGRIFIAADGATTAAVMFGKAREAEIVYSLPVHETTRREAFLEFAFAGALTVKALANHAAELSRRYEPARAYTEFRELSLRRTLGGLPPWTNLPKQLRSLATAAGLDAGAEETALLRELIDIPVAAAAPGGFWRAARASTVALGRADADAARALLGLFPNGDTAFQGWWLDLLADAGALDLLSDAGEAVPGGAAGWLSRMVRHVRGWRSTTPAQLFDLLPRIAERLIADGEPLYLDGGYPGRGREVDLGLLDLCLHLGVPVHPPREGSHLDLADWAYSGRKVPRRDLASLLADPVWEPLLEQAVADYGGHQEVLEDLLPYPFLHPYVDRRLHALVGGLAGKALGEAQVTIESLSRQVRGEAFTAFPDRRAELDAVDFDEILARTLRAGILDEYGWDALDEAVRELAGDRPKKHALTTTTSWPVLTLTSQTKAIAVGPKGRVAEHDLRLPPGGKQPLAVYSGGQFLVCYRQGYDDHAYWSTDPETRLEIDNYGAVSNWRWHTTGSPAQLGADGLRLSGHRALAPGDKPAKADLRLLGDGATYWVHEHNTLREVDPVTGGRGRASLPAFLEELPVAQGEHLLLGSSSLARLPDGCGPSPLGHADGLAGFAVVRTSFGRGWGATHSYRVTTIDGRTRAVALKQGERYARPVPAGLISYPGGAEHVLSNDNGLSLHGADGAQIWSCHIGSACDCTAKLGTPYLPEVAFWHFMTARDVVASARLRSVRAADLAPLLTAAEEEHRDAAGAARTEAAAAALLADGSHTPHPSLVKGVAGIALAVVRQQRALRRKAVQVTRTAAVPVQKESAALTKGLQRFLSARPSGPSDTVAQIRTVSDFLRGSTDADAASRHPHSSVDWTGLVGAIALPAWYAVLPSTPEDVRSELVGFLGAWSETVFADPSASLDHGLIRLAGEDRIAHAAPDGRRRLGLNMAAYIPDIERRYGKFTRARRFVELRRGPALTIEAPAAEHERDRMAPGWGSPAQLQALVTAAAEHGPLTWDPEAAQLLADRTGLTRAAAVLLLTCSMRLTRWERPLAPQARTLLGLKAAEAELGATELSALGRDGLLPLFRSVLPETPEEIAGLWSPGGTLVVAERLAEAWNARFGPRLPLDGTTLAALGSLAPSAQVLDWVRMLADPAGAPALAQDTRSWLGREERGNGHRAVELFFSDRTTITLSDIVPALTALIPWAYTELPEGNPVRSGIPAVLRAVLDRLAAPDLLLFAMRSWAHGDESRNRLLEQIGGTPYRDPKGTEPFGQSGDNGVSVLVAEGAYAQLYFRPARLGDDADSRVLRAMAADSSPYGALVNHVDLLRSPGFAAIAQRVADGLPDGAYEFDPGASAPRTTEEAAQALGVSSEAARLYLQLLAMLEPTDKRVRAANGWTPARHKKAQTELVDAGLVVAAKRSRAGRSVFLPGQWIDAKAPNLPFEAWKLPLYGLTTDSMGRPEGQLTRFVALDSLPAIVDRAWQRVRGGDGPR